MLERDQAADRLMAETASLAKYLPHILLYPLTGHALWVWLLLTMLLWIGMQSIFGIALLAIAAPWTFHYAEAVIEQTAIGRATPPPFGGDMIFLGSNFSAFRPLLGVALAVTLWGFARVRGPGAEIAALAVSAFLFPAYMLLLTAHNSLLVAFNPLKLVGAIIAVGPVYFVVCMILALAAAGVVETVGSGIQIVAVAASIYLWLMTFHLLGYVAYHRHERLGFPVKTPPPTDKSRAMDRQRERLAAVLRNVDAALNAKDLDGAGRALLADLGENLPEPRVFFVELFEQLQRRRNVALLHLQGQRLISLLVGEKRLSHALDVAETCFDAHRDFQPDTPAQAIALAEAALEAKREGLFQRLTGDAATRYAGTPTAASLQFLVVRQAYDKRDEARARDLLLPLLAQTAHPQHRQMAAFAKILGMGAKLG